MSANLAGSWAFCSSSSPDCQRAWYLRCEGVGHFRWIVLRLTASGLFLASSTDIPN